MKIDKPTKNKGKRVGKQTKTGGGKYNMAHRDALFNKIMENQLN